MPNPAPATEHDHRPIDPNLPPDTPLEPRATRGRNASPAERIAASEAALGPAKPPVIPDPGGKTNFIAAARRAAQAAGSERGVRPDASPGVVSTTKKPAVRWNTRMRHLLVGASAVAIVFGSLHLAANLLLNTDAPETAPARSAMPASPSDQAHAPGSSAQPASGPAASQAAAPAATQSLIFPGSNAIPFATRPSGIVMPTARQSAKADQPEDRSAANSDPIATGSVPRPAAGPASTHVTPLPQHAPPRLSPTEALPSAIGSHALRAAAAKGDVGAEYEVALRYAEGRGVPKNLTAASQWFERAAEQGLVMAQFRLGGHYEKGLGVKKDTDAARRLYTAAAEAGNAKAMHNLAVLYAEGMSNKPDYQMAANWFRKAADYGVADSQYNLGILYARGIGVEADLSEAYKWFALASRDGDKEAAKKRDDIGGRLDQKALTAARAAVQAWAAATQPQTAIEVRAPAGGWDNMPAPSVAKRTIGPKAAATPANPAQ
jgi:localization factor PodJL